MARLTRYCPGIASRWMAAVGWGLVATGAHAQRLGGGGGVTIPVGRIVAAFLLCVLLALLLAVTIKRRGGRLDLGRFSGLLTKSASQARIDVVETRRASQHADICLIRCDTQEYLVLCSAHVQTVLRADLATDTIATGTALSDEGKRAG